MENLLGPKTMTRRTRLARILVKEIGVRFVSQGNRTVDSPIQVRNYQLKPEIPVGGRLNFFQKNWEKITDDQWIISIMKEGYKLEFLKKPLGSGIKETSVSSKNIDILQEEIYILIQKDVIEPIPNRKFTQVFTVHFFWFRRRTEK
jgi:hypothetical protein